MNDSFWLKLVGFDATRIPDEADAQLIWTNAPQSWRLFLLIGIAAAVAYAVVLLYRRELDTCPRWGRILLAFTRLAVLSLLLLVFLGPAVAPTQRHVIYPSIALLRDASQSMNTPDRYLEDEAASRVADATSRTVAAVRDERPTRVQLVNEILRHDQFIRQLEERGKLRIVDFSNQVVEIETRQVRKGEDDDGQEREVRPLPTLQATGQGTDLYRAVSQALSDKQTSSIVAFTDGQHTVKDRGRDELVALAEKAAEQGVPLLLVGTGDPNRPRNLQVTDVYADPQVWRGDPFEIQATLQAYGAGQQDVQVTLTQRALLDDNNPAESETILQRREIALPAEGGQQRLVFTHTCNVEGRFLYNVRVAPIENELSESDNQPDSPAEVKVLGQQARVLLVAGSPTWEFRGLQRMLTREKSIAVSCWLQTMDVARPQDGNTIIDRLPVTREAIFQYDVVVLLDPDPIEFDEAWLDLLKQFIGEHAGGFLYMAGPKFSGRFLASEKTKKLRDILPVRFGDVRAMEVESLLQSNSRSWRLGIIEANVDQPIMRFYPEQTKTLDRWKALPGIYWSFPAREPKPAARTLIEHSDPTLRTVDGSRPLLVTGQYGSGRSVYVGFNGTWRWRRVGHNSEFFKRFWIQSIRYLVEGRTLEGKRRGIVEADGFRYQLGDRVRLTARLKDSSYRPLEVSSVSATLRVAGRTGEPLTLTQVADQPGCYETLLTARATGQHLVHIELGEATSNPPRIETSFSVSLPSVEINEVWLDKALLTELADVSGGKYFDIDELNELPASVPHAEQMIDVRGTPVPLWDTRRILLLLVGLLGVEWAVRKRFKLL